MAQACSPVAPGSMIQNLLLQRLDLGLVLVISCPREAEVGHVQPRLRPMTPRPTMPLAYRCFGCLLVMVLPLERFAEIGGIDFHLHSFGNARRAVRAGSFSGLIFPDLALRLEPVLNRVAFASSLLIQFIGSLGDLRPQIG